MMIDDDDDSINEDENKININTDIRINEFNIAQFKIHDLKNNIYMKI